MPLWTGLGRRSTCRVGGGESQRLSDKIQNLYLYFRFVGQKLWQIVPKEIKETQSLDIFKRNIKAIPLDYSCKLCKSYIVNLGFL